MITYVDTSTLIKLLIDERGTPEAQRIWSDSSERVSVSLIEVEAHAALAAAARNERLTTTEHRRTKRALGGLIDSLDRMAVTRDLILHASHHAERDALRGYDAVHLAAALEIGADIITSADADLCEAATRHGLAVANPLDAASD